MKVQVQWVTILLFLLLFGCVFSVHSASKVKELEKQRKMLLIEIKNTNKFLNENHKSIGDVQRRVDLLVKQVNTREQLVKILGNEIGVFNKKIQDKEIQIAQLERNLHLKKRNYAIAIQIVYQEKNNQDQLFFILSASNIVQSFHRALYMKEYGKWRRAQGEEIIIQQNKVIAEKQVLKYDVQTKTNLVNIKKNEEEKLRIQERIKGAEIENLKKNTKKLQAEIDKKKRQAEVLEREIARIIKEELAATKKAAARGGSVKRKSETADGYAMTKEEQTLSTDFAKNKGKLPFPLKGSYCIVSRFGQHRYGNMENIHYNSNGIDIKTTQENSARAVFDGIVTRIFILPGYQVSVIVRHGNYLTLYSYLEQVFVKQGDKLKIGQCIGKIYTDKENGNLTILHFELWKEQTKLNPELWLYR